MVHLIPPPEPRSTLLPLLACLPTAFLSPHPPPALLPLLSPILRQRVHLLASSSNQQPQARSSDPSTTQYSSQRTWLPLLVYSPHSSAALVDIVSKLNLEPHPASGELEVDVSSLLYLRKDSQTLLARCDVRDLRLRVVWCWCVNDSGGTGIEALQDVLVPGGKAGEAKSNEAQDKWLVQEVIPLDDEGQEICDDGSTPRTFEQEWYSSVTEAEQAMKQYTLEEEERTPTTTNGGAAARTGEESDDEDYWASYDRTPGRTPSGKSSPGRVPSSSRFAQSGLKPLTSITNGAGVQPQTRRADETSETASERDYYARYGDVQPALDAHDPDEEEGTRMLESTQRSDQVIEQPTPTRRHDLPHLQPTNPSNDTHNPHPAPPPTAIRGSIAAAAQRVFDSHEDPNDINQFDPMSFGLGNDDAGQPPSEVRESVELGVKQHISSEIKSLFRLARSVGIDRKEFERVLQREVEVLGLIEEL